MSVIEKIKRLVTEGATPGERMAAIKALERKGVALDIIVSSDQVALVPLEMVTPNQEGIYTPSRFEAPITCPQLPKQSKKIMVSLAADGISDAHPMTCYIKVNSFWMKQ